MYVIARFNEPTKEYPDPHFIVQKDEHLPNKGRESSSYLWYIIKNYDNLPEIVRFRQAKDHEHPIGEFKLTSDWNGEPHHGGLPIKNIAEQLNLEIPQQLYFTPGAQFDVPRENILQRTKEWYQNAYEVSLQDQAPWCIERLWKYIFNLFWVHFVGYIIRLILFTAPINL